MESDVPLVQIAPEFEVWKEFFILVPNNFHAPSAQADLTPL